MSAAQKLRIGYVPEHFSIPLHFAHENHGLREHASLEAFPSGTGTMIEAFKEARIDVGIGLTEAWVAGLASHGALEIGSAAKPYHIVSEYVSSPLRWALSTGSRRDDVKSVDAVRGRRVGVSRMGSGSHIMSMVLADQRGWMTSENIQSFDTVVCGPFAELRKAVNESRAEFFMWEHFTTKKFWDNGQLKRIGEIVTPWNGWHITARGLHTDRRVNEILLPALTQGVHEFSSNKERAVSLICKLMEYSREDAEEWYEEVRFPESFARGVNEKGISASISSLQKVGIVNNPNTPWQAVLAASKH